MQIPFSENKKLDLPQTVQAVDASSVQFLTPEDIPRVLMENEELLRRELQTDSDLDRFVTVPEGHLIPQHSFQSSLTSTSDSCFLFCSAFRHKVVLSK